MDNLKWKRKLMPERRQMDDIFNGTLTSAIYSAALAKMDVEKGI